MKRRRRPRAARKLPLGFSRQTQSGRRIEVLNRVPRDLLNRTRRTVRLPGEVRRVRSHLRLPLRLRDFVTAEVIGVGERHRVDGLFLWDAAVTILTHDAAHLESARRNQQHFDVAGVVADAPRKA